MIFKAHIHCRSTLFNIPLRSTNLALYRQLSKAFDLEITASGGVSTLEDVKALRAMELYGAIIGKAYYTGAIDLREALEVAK